jgi:hypothetical protein
MDRNEIHRIARILEGPAYDGNLVEKLVEAVEKAERSNKKNEFYRPEKFQRVTTCDSASTPATSRYEEDNCEHCHAAYGHKIHCPLLSRETGENILSFDARFAKSVGIKLDS